MEAPGEKLVIKLWETLAEKGIGSLLKPWQIRREGRAIAETQAESLVLLAQAENTAEEIRKNKLNHDRVLQFENNGAPKIEPEIDSAKLVKLAAKISLEKTIRSEVNTAKAILVAESILKDQTEEPPQANIDQDWLYRWRDYTSDVSSSELHALWGKLLAGEVKAPGTFSLRTLDFLRNLSSAEASRIESLMQFVVRDFIYKGQNQHSLELLNKFGLLFHDFLEMQELGIISGLEAVGGITITLSPANPVDRYIHIYTKNQVIVVTFPDHIQKLILECFPLTSLGKELLELCEVDSNIEYLELLLNDLKGRGLKVQMFDIKVI